VRRLSRRTGAQSSPAESSRVYTGDVRVTPLGDGLVLVSVPIGATRLTDRAGLTDAEREVSMLAATGLTNASIASRRSSSERTIANQLAAAYVKLGVTGRRGLRAFLSRGTR
jgi:DNA-binding CsgD family transcriptional regulator